VVVSLARPLLRLTTRRPHVLTIAPAPTSDTLLAVRLAAETELARRGWPAAESPADADLVLVAGEVGPRMARVVRAVWATVPAPRALVSVESVGELAEALDAAVAWLARDGADARSSASEAIRTSTPIGLASSGRKAASSLPMADLADDDRDGLALDALHVPLGPVLPHWPPGLVVHATLAGDLVTDARAEVLDVPGPRAPTGPRRSRRGPDHLRLDALVRVLGLAGADRAAARARDLRDGDPAPGELSTFGRRLARSRTLAWTLRGIPLSATDHVPVPENTVEARVRRLAAGLGTSLAPPVRPAPHRAVAALVGLELGAARLALAAMDPDTGLGAGPVDAVDAHRPAAAHHEHAGHHGHA
jgi:fructose-specific component phosphotransferase system IIB-like protein